MSKERLKKFEKKLDEVEILKSQLKRVLADYDNLKKRVERESAEIETLITSRVITRMLPSIDMFYEVQKNINDAGLAMSINSLEETLKQENIVKIDAKEGDEFDENLHEAIDIISTEDNSLEGKISEQMQSGWRFVEGQVIRHAKVVVFK